MNNLSAGARKRTLWTELRKTSDWFIIVITERASARGDICPEYKVNRTFGEQIYKSLPLAARAPVERASDTTLCVHIEHLIDSVKRAVMVVLEAKVRRKVPRFHIGVMYANYTNGAPKTGRPDASTRRRSFLVTFSSRARARERE